MVGPSFSGLGLAFPSPGGDWLFLLVVSTRHSFWGWRVGPPFLLGMEGWPFFGLGWHFPFGVGEAFLPRFWVGPPCLVWKLALPSRRVVPLSSGGRGLGLVHPSRGGWPSDSALDLALSSEGTRLALSYCCGGLGVVGPSCSWGWQCGVNENWPSLFEVQVRPSFLEVAPVSSGVRVGSSFTGCGS